MSVTGSAQQAGPPGADAHVASLLQSPLNLCLWCAAQNQFPLVKPKGTMHFYAGAEHNYTASILIFGGFIRLDLIAKVRSVSCCWD